MCTSLSLLECLASACPVNNKVNKGSSCDGWAFQTQCQRALQEKESNQEIQWHSFKHNPATAHASSTHSGKSHAQGLASVHQVLNILKQVHKARGSEELPYVLAAWIVEYVVTQKELLGF
jgi:hypothetical protein